MLIWLLSLLMVVETMRDGSYLIYEIIDDQLKQRKFYYNSKEKAIEEFNKYFKEDKDAINI
jgi:hypothetical protein